MRGTITSRSAIVWILTGLNLFNYLDRYVVTAVSPKIQESLDLSDFQIGIVLSAFMLGYFLTSPVFGWLGDRGPRRGLIAAGVLLWSLATAASGLARGFWAMVATRLFVGVGEASYATISPTIIDDLTTPATKSRWLSLFFAAIPVGSAAGFALGGFLEHHWGWRSAFFVAGLPGILLALLVSRIAEPARTARVEGTGDREAPRGGAKARTSGYGALLRIPAYRSAVLGYTAYTFALGGFAAWAPKYLYAVLRMELRTADFWFGALLAAAGFAGTAAGGWLGDAFPGADRVRANLRVCAIVTLLAAPLAALCLVAGSPVAFFAAFGATAFLLFTATAPVNAVILQSVPPSLRATAMAMSIFTIHLLGDLISPPLIGAVSDAAGSLRTAMFVLPVAIAVGAAIWGIGSATTTAAAPKVEAPGLGA